MGKISGRRHMRYVLPVLLAAVVFLAVFSSRSGTKPYHKDKGFIFGTTYSVVYQSDSALSKGILDELHKVDSALSTFNSRSEISAVNDNRDIVVGDMFRRVFELSMDVSSKTDGAFDITVAPLVNAWGFGFKTGTSPTKEGIDSLLETVGYEKVALKDGRVVKQNPNVMLDCSAVAKGFASDVVAELFRSHGVENFMIEIGGEIVAGGVNERGEKWRVGISKPVDDSLNTDNEIVDILSVSGKAVATSGNYRNFYYKDGKKYYHTIDPKTGYPAGSNMLSATVVADNCATADAYATALMALGGEKARSLLERQNKIAAYIIYRDSTSNEEITYYTPEIEEMLLK